jgi:protein-S-isoprenylcysteine O-methyltransferase Ste14
MWLYIGLGALVALGIYCWVGMRRVYEQGEILPFNVVAAIWTTDTLHFVLVLWGAVRGIWPMPLRAAVALSVGLALAILGLTVMIPGMLEFRSLKRMSGMDSSRLVTTGLYRYSRNPQYAGWCLALVGTSIAGRSFFALLLTAVLIVGIHLYTVKLEEPYLERVFGEEYTCYRNRTPRYFGIPKEGKV